MSCKFSQDRIRWTIKKWNIKDYIRQLSIVIAGIVITFVASDAVSEHSKQQEVKKITDMVREELDDNLKSLHFLKTRLQLEQRLFTLIFNHLQDFSKLPADTLKKYTSLPGNDYTYLFKTQSLDVLKNSGIIPHIRNKDFLHTLFSCYVSLETSQHWINNYYKSKTSTTEKWLYSTDLTTDRKLYASEEAPIDVTFYWNTILENNNTRNFYLNAPAYLETVLRHCRETEELLEKALQSFDKS